MSYDPDKMAEEAERAKNVDGSDLEAQIVAVSQAKAREIFESPQGDPDREMVQAEVEVTMPDGETATFEESFTTPKGAFSWRNPDFKLGQFKDTYGDVPRVGMEVEVGFNDSGQLRIVT